MTTTRLPAGFAGTDPPEAWPPPRGRPRAGELERPVESLRGVGPALAAKLARLGLARVGDLVEHAPFRYVSGQRIADLFGEGEEVAIEATVERVSVRKPRRRLTIVEAVVSDESGSVRATWFNQPWVAERLAPGSEVRLIGSMRRGSFAVRSHEHAAPAELVPVYGGTEDLNPRRLRELVLAALPRAVWDPLPAPLCASERLPTRADALWALHRPRSREEAETGRRRLAFDELLLLQVGIARRARERERALAASLGEPGELIERYRSALPFTLTPYQESAIRELDTDLARTVPMQRLLQGDVGSGKTVVALYALLRAVENGRQGALMAPTETLAEQHYLTIADLCTSLGVTCALLTSSSSKAERQRAPTADVVVGTHALIQEGVELRDLAVAVVDEQHRFGVEQRSALSSAAACDADQRSSRLGRGDRLQRRAPHVLHMTATPIPRTLALTVYGDLAVSEIAKPPASRKPIVTSWIPEERASAAYTRLRRLLDDGRQAYVVCPLIEESETSRARAAEQEAERLARAELKGYRIGCLHGRLRPADRRRLMARFKAHELDVLVATTVIEVGVDVPNATVMIVQEADRFGLAQLHQLRGRVGRGAEQSYCVLVSRARDELTDDARERLDALVATTNGFELAEKDLELRGGGQLLGRRQAGFSGLRFAHLLRDRPLLERARSVAGHVPDAGPLADEVDALFANDHSQPDSSALM